MFTQMIRRTVACLAVCLIGIATPAFAEVIDFQSLQVVNNTFNDVGNTYSEDGFTFTKGGGEPFPFAVWGTLAGEYPGSTALFNNTVNGVTVLTKDGGGLFSISSIDLANLNGPGNVTVTFIGTYADLTTTIQAFNFNSFGALSTFNFNASFANLVALSWGQITPFHQFDNLVVNVPEPTSLLLVGIGLAGAGLRRRMRSKKA